MAVSPNPYEEQNGHLTCFDCGSKRFHLFPRSAENLNPEVCAGCLGLPDPSVPLNWEPNPLYPDIIGMRLRRTLDGKGVARGLPSLFEWASREWKYPDVLLETELSGDDGALVRTCALEFPTKYGCFYTTYFINPTKNIVREMEWYRVQEEALRCHPLHVRFAENKRK